MATHDIEQAEAGRFAENVFEIPAKGWKQILKRTVAQISEDNVSIVAGGATFFLVLAIFPAMAAFVAIYGLFFDPAAVTSQIEALRGVLPEAAVGLLADELGRLTAQPQSSLGIGFAVGLLVALWSANAGMKALFAAMNIAYDETEERGFFKLTLVSLVCTIGGLFAIAVLFATVGVLPQYLGRLELGPEVNQVILIARWPVLFLFIVFAMGLLYKIGPSRKPPRWRWIGWGTLLTALVWIAASAAFAFYLSNFANYNATYGALGAVIGFMMWLYVSLMVLLVGAELNSEIEHQVATDTTTGPYKPRGKRQARKADTLPDEQTDS